MNKKFIGKGLLVLSLSSTLACGSSSTTATATDTTLAKVIPALAVTSPTAGTSTTTASTSKTTGFFAKIEATISKLFSSTSVAVAETATAPTEVKPLSDMVDAVKSNINSADPTAVAAKIGGLTVTSYRAPCYGPTWTDNATGSTVNRPSGDLGMVDANANGTTDTTACAAGQLNALLGGAPQFANKVITLQSTMIAAMRKSSKTIPEKAATVDAKDDMPTISGMTLSSAKISRLSDDAAGLPVYKTVMAFTDANQKTGSITIYHTPKNEDNSNYKGLIQAVLPHSPNGGSGTHRGLSMVYDQTDGVLTYALDIAANRQTASTDFFSTTTGRVDFTKTAFGEDGNRIIASFNTTTNATTMHYAWQAGSQDGATRSFAVAIPAGTKGSLTGYAYFGFGAAISSLTDDVSSPWMTKMYCNWLQGLANGATVAKVQAQSFKQDATTGKFVADVSKISFAPTNTCDAASFTVSNAQPTTYNGSKAIAANELVTVGALGTIPAVTVPSYTIPTE